MEVLSGTSGSGKSSLIKSTIKFSHCYTGTVKIKQRRYHTVSEDDIRVRTFSPLWQHFCRKKYVISTDM
ncbi:ATP-binding cassette domain-containing protein [Salmonella enterica subsp. enterica serovar Weltevreden]|nr:ATP-binding cassette domain-containing protein [Salmonella enterica subsp. enterica serovar Weltevreden]